MRPIVPRGSLARLADIGLQADIDDGAILPPLARSEEASRLRVWLRFVPGLTRATGWRVSYRPAGLWDPLRRTGVDDLSWDDSMQNSIDGVSALIELKILFVFPPGRAQCTVKERQSLGFASEAYVERTGHTVIEWLDPRPAGRRYHWDLTMAPVGSEPPRVSASDASSGSQPIGVAG
jgi:hypothetical protein